ncbi:hypothetical protein [Methanomethylovorans sp.]
MDTSYSDHLRKIAVNLAGAAHAGIHIRKRERFDEDPMSSAGLSVFSTF